MCLPVCSPATSFSGAGVKVALWYQGAWEPLVWSLGQSRTVFCERCFGEGLAALCLPGALVLLDSLAHAALYPLLSCFRPVSYSSTNGPSVAREKRLCRLTEAPLSRVLSALPKAALSSFGQGPCAELSPCWSPGLSAEHLPTQAPGDGKKAATRELTPSPDHTPELDVFRCGHRSTS